MQTYLRSDLEGLLLCGTPALVAKHLQVLSGHELLHDVEPSVLGRVNLKVLVTLWNTRMLQRRL
jgi:hypothetical protein